MIDFIKNMVTLYEESLRMTGRTTHLIEKAKATDSIIVCYKREHAMQLKEEFGVETVYLSEYLNNSYHYGNRNKKYLFDNAAEYVLIMNRLEEVKDIMNRNY